MQFSIDSLDERSICVTAPLAPNINIHGTAFAGSIYSVAVLTGWALCTHMLEQAGIDAELVVAKAEIRYRAPIGASLVCATQAPSAECEQFLDGARRQGKGVLELEIAVGDNRQALLKAAYCALTPK